MTIRFRSIAACALLGVLSSLAANQLAAETFNGWRGNGTGIWSDAKPVLHWGRTPQGALLDLQCQARRPDEPAKPDGKRVEKGLLRDWLVLGPFPVDDVVKQFDRDFLDGEANAEPTVGDEVGELRWQPLKIAAEDVRDFGTAIMPPLDLTKAFEFKPKQVAYAHTYLYSPRGGRAELVLDHSFGLAAWLNGREIYRRAERHSSMAYYSALGPNEWKHQLNPSPRCTIELSAGWNRLLLKVSTPNVEGHNEMRVISRIIDPPDVAYKDQNIVWMTELPARSTSTPIFAGDNIVLMAEPDELVCLDRETGKIRWRRCVNAWEALAPEKRAAFPQREEIETLNAAIEQETDRRQRVALRAKRLELLAAGDRGIFMPAVDGHFESHFAIVGLTMPTPVFDGEFLYVWQGSGIAAKFNLAGERQWITRVEPGPLTYGSSPAVAGGVMAAFLNRVYGFDVKTGKLLWEQPKVNHNVGAMLAARLADEDVFLSQRGEVLRASDGALLFRPRGLGTGDEGWAPPVVLGDALYLPRFGVNRLAVFDFGVPEAKRWQPKLVQTAETGDKWSRDPDTGKWIDRMTAGSPLIHGGIVYNCDIYQTLFLLDLENRQGPSAIDLPLAGYMHYNAVPVAASVTLMGEHLFVFDNQGNSVVLKPGLKPEIVATNHLHTQLDRDWPLSPQETSVYAPPIAHGDRFYLRGERYLYCIGSDQGPAKINGL
jgi:outer membrane protein assembly factor BamB